MIDKNLFSIILINGYPVVPVVPLLLTQASFLKVTTLNNENTKIAEKKYNCAVNKMI